MIRPDGRGQLAAPGTKLRALVDAWSAGDREGALRIAARFPRLGDATRAIRTGGSASANPRFYAELGRDPAALIAAGLEALARRFDLPPEDS